MVILWQSGITDSLGSLRIQCTGKLCIPVQHSSGIRHLIINISCMWDSLGNIGRMGCNLGGNDTIFHIFHIRKC